MMLGFVDKNTKGMKTVPSKFKILAARKTDWVPIIVGGMSIDCSARGGLGMSPMKNSFYLASLNINIERLDKYSHGRPHHSVYAEETILACRSGIARSALDSDSSDEEDHPDNTGIVGLMHATPNGDVEQKAQDYNRMELDELVLNTTGVLIPTGGGALVPVRRNRVQSAEDSADVKYRVEDYWARRMQGEGPNTYALGATRRQLRQVSADVLESGAQYVAHQCNCKTDSAAAWAATIFERYPRTDTYATGKLREPGTVDVFPGIGNEPGIIICDAQLGPSGPIIGDTADLRLGWFRECL